MDSWRPDPIREKLWTNLLELSFYPETIYVAKTEYRKPKAFWEAVRDRTSEPVEAPVLLSGESITTFQNLREFPWSELCDLGTCEEFDSEEWAESDDEQRMKDFVQLLNRCLKEMLWPKVIFDKKKEYYYFRASKNLKSVEFDYMSRINKTPAVVFGPHMKKKSSGIAFYRHAALETAFRRFGERWYLALGPTYHFTRDGEKEDFYSSDHLATKKRFEKNHSVSGQVIMWAEYVKSRHKPLLVQRQLDLPVSDN